MGCSSIHDLFLSWELEKGLGDNIGRVGLNFFGDEYVELRVALYRERLEGRI